MAELKRVFGLPVVAFAVVKTKTKGVAVRPMMFRSTGETLGGVGPGDRVLGVVPADKGAAGMYAEVAFDDIDREALGTKEASRAACLGFLTPGDTNPPDWHAEAETLVKLVNAQRESFLAKREAEKAAEVAPESEDAPVLAGGA